jgi:predicted RNA-binding protein with PIN domain
MAKIDDLSMLANVIMAARSELMDRDPEDVPKKLSRAVAATGKRIPPPHQRAILAHIEADEGFRDAVRGVFVESDIDDPLGLEYLTDPVATLSKVELAVAIGHTEELQTALNAETAETAKVRDKLAVSRERYELAKSEASKKLSERTDADKRARSGLENTARDAQERAEVATLAAQASQRDLEARETEIEVLEDKIVRLNEKLAKRGSSLSQRPEGQRSSVLGDPSEIARDLDGLERRLRTYREAHVDDKVQRAELPPIAVPKGVSPSDAAVIDAMIRQRPDRVIIDGYNVSGLIAPNRFATRAARDDVVHRAAKLVRETDAAIVVVFDAHQSTEGTSTLTSAEGVEVVFEGDTIADDTIAAMVHADSDRCIVITNDREIHNRVRRSGCVSIFSTAFVSWTEHLNRS